MWQYYFVRIWQWYVRPLEIVILCNQYRIRPLLLSLCVKGLYCAVIDTHQGTAEADEEFNCLNWLGTSKSGNGHTCFFSNLALLCDFQQWRSRYPAGLSKVYVHLEIPDVGNLKHNKSLGILRWSAWSWWLCRGLHNLQMFSFNKVNSYLTAILTLCFIICKSNQQNDS